MSKDVEKSKKKSVKKDRNLTFGEKVMGVGGGTVAGLAATTGASIASTFGSLAALTGAKKENFDMGRLRELVTGKAEDSSLATLHTKTPHGLDSHYASQYVVDKGLAPYSLESGNLRYVAAPEGNAAITAHELSHSSSKLINSKPGAVAYGISTKATQGLSPLYGLVQGARGKDLSTTEKATMLGISAPMLYEETRANLKAFNALRQLKHKQGLLRASLPLLGSQLSYSAAASMPFIAHKGAKSARDYIDNKNREGDNSE
jgi:hypothetical protein